ncbi:hypothetical protein HKX48_007280 [Thoreauomyces humboldtii]|nr:hypothetical protein HKX48_007280 [Thoreauomyces humboldtii]
MLQAALDKVGILVALRDATENGTEKPDRRKKRKLDEKPRAAAAAPPKKPKPKEESVTMLGPGQPIIARPRSEGQEWIMGKIEKWVPERGMYQVKDDEDDEELPSVAGKSKELLYYLPKDVVPLATEQEAARRPVFVKDHKVLAHYPTTTCFYRAKVKLPPHKGQPVYTLLFEDDNAVERLVPAHMIVDRASTFVKAAV